MLRSEYGHEKHLELEEIMLYQARFILRHVVGNRDSGDRNRWEHLLQWNTPDGAPIDRGQGDMSRLVSSELDENDAVPDISFQTNSSQTNSYRCSFISGYPAPPRPPQRGIRSFGRGRALAGKWPKTLGLAENAPSSLSGTPAVEPLISPVCHNPGSSYQSHPTRTDQVVVQVPAGPGRSEVG